MKFFTIASLALASVAAGQSLADLPSCALTCLNDAVKQSTSCAATDLACICKQFDAIQGAAAGCILGACGQDVALSELSPSRPFYVLLMTDSSRADKVLPATQKLCANAGSGSGSGTEKPAPTATETPTGTVVPVPPPETTQAPPSEPTSTGAPTSPPVVTAGAAAFGPVGGLAMLAAAVLAL
jgi:hypothetical protein